MIRDKYQIQVSFNSIGLRVTEPANSTLEWTFEKEEGEVFYRKKLSTPLLFKDDPTGAHDFTKLYTQERNRRNRCDKADVIVFKRCMKTGEWIQHWNGYLSMIDGKWDVSKCEVEIVPRIQDQYTCLLEQWEKNVNILSFSINRYDSRSTIGVIEYRSCSRVIVAVPGGIPEPAYQGNAGCIDETEYFAGHGWTLVNWHVQDGSVHPVVDLQPGQSLVETIWAREVVAGGPRPGPDFNDDNGVWVRSVEVIEDLNQYQNEGGLFRRVWRIVQYTLTNGLKLNDVIKEMLLKLTQCQYTVVSNFFGINPDGTAPTNRAYNKAFDHARSLYIYEKQDVRRAKDKDQSSFIFEISFKKLYENLRALFDVRYIIDEDTRILRLEHISYFEDKRMLDLTQARYQGDIKGKWKYSYTKEDMPLKEIFKFMEPTTPPFDGLPITYDAVCSNDQKQTNETTITADSVVTDVDDVVEYPDKYNTQGFVLVERSPTGYIISGQTYGEWGVHRNGNLSWPALHDHFHRWQRPQGSGIMNGKPTNFETFKRTRKQEPIQIQLCGTDFENFDPIDLVRTQLGWGSIYSAKYVEPQETLTIETIHD